MDKVAAKCFSLVHNWRGESSAKLWYNWGMAYIRKFKTSSGATGVQVCYKEGNRVVKTVHVGSADSDKALKKLLKQARDLLDQDKGTPMFNLDRFEKS